MLPAYSFLLGLIALLGYMARNAWYDVAVLIVTAKYQAIISRRRSNRLRTRGAKGGDW